MSQWIADGSAVAALVLGAVSSGHCLLMCGPLACAASADEPHALARSPADARSQRRRAAIAWQLGRVAGYALVGALLGASGKALSLLLSRSITPLLPWVLAAGLLVGALLPKRTWTYLPRLPGGAQALRAWRWVGANLARTQRAAMLGALTPLLPCGLLYALFAAEIATGSAGSGTLVGAAFAVGGVPALAAAQLGSRWLGRTPPWTRRLVPIMAAAMLIWRAVTTTAAHCPACH